MKQYFNYPSSFASSKGKFNDSVAWHKDIEKIEFLEWK